MTNMNLDQADGWRPEVGDVIVGEVIDIARQRSEFTGQLYPIITVQPEDGPPVAIHCFHTVLRNRMIELKPLVGETVGVKYIAATEKDGKKNKPAIYNVKIKGRAAENPYAGMQSELDLGTDVPADTSDFKSVSQSEDDDIPF